MLLKRKEFRRCAAPLPPHHAQEQKGARAGDPAGALPSVLFLSHPLRSRLSNFAPCGAGSWNPRDEGISKSVLADPRRNFPFHRKLCIRVPFEPLAQFIGIDLEGNPVVAAARQKTAHI